MSEEYISSLRFRDLKVGDRFQLGEAMLSRPEMIEFASRYDPQPFHLDDEAARKHPLFDRLSASGWHTALLVLPLLDRFWKRTKVRGLAGAGIDQIRWEEPVYADEPLRCEMELEMVRPSASKPERGLITMHVTARKTDGRLAMLLRMTAVFENN